MDPVKGPWTFCANLLNVTGAPPQVHHNLLPENPNVAVVMRMMADIRREVAGITGEDEEGAARLRDSYKDEKTKEERKHKEVMTQQKELQRVSHLLSQGHRGVGCALCSCFASSSNLILLCCS